MPVTNYKGLHVLVTGATGFTGSVMVRKLVAQGALVHAIARPESDRGPLSDLPIRWTIGQIFDPGTVQAATAGVQYIFHMATMYRHAAASDDLNEKVHVLGTRLLVEAVVGRSDFQRFIHVSTIGVHGNIEHPPAREDAPIKPEDIYQRTKAEGEALLRQLATKHGIPFTVLRPCGLYGPGERRFLKFFQLSSRRLMFLLGQKGCGLHLIHVDDFVDVALRAGLHPDAVNEVFICGSPENVSLERFAHLVAQALGNQITVIRLPAAPFYFLAYLCELACRPFGIEPPIHRRRIGFFTKNRSFDTSKMRKVLGFECAYPNEVGLPATARWYAENGWLKPGSPRKP